MRSRKLSGKSDESGQSTIEFALTMILFLAFFLFYFQLCMVFALGSYVHYATFMSARALFAAGGAGGDQTEQIGRARTVLISMLKKSQGQAGVDKFPSISKGVGGGNLTGAQFGQGDQYQPGNTSYSWMQGVRYTTMSNLFLIPLGGPLGRATQGGDGGSVNTVQLISESWLGRSVSNAECAQQMSQLSGIIDNGC